MIKNKHIYRNSSKENLYIVSGLIFDPIKNEMFFAEKDNGAFFNNHRIKVSKKNELNDCLFVTGGKIHKNSILLTENQDVQL